MAIRGKTAELLVKLNPALYRPYIWYTKKGVPMLYVLIEKALYDMLRAALLFYRKLRANPEDMGFEVNFYDPWKLFWAYKAIDDAFENGWQGLSAESWGAANIAGERTHDAAAGWNICSKNKKE